MSTMDANLTVDMNKYEYLVCSECGHNVFVPGVIFKMVPGVLMGVGDQKTVPVPLKVACCAKCGALSPEDKKIYNAETKKEESPNGGIII